MGQGMNTLPHSDEDYAAFIDKNVHTYLPKFHGYGMDPAGFHPGWNWAAFFFTFWWFLYRKMYVWAVICFATLWVPYFNILVWIGWGVAANCLYFKHSTAKIAEIKSLQGGSYRVYLRGIGGVNGWVPWLALLVSGGFFLLVILGFLGMAFLTSAWVASWVVPFTPGVAI